MRCLSTIKAILIPIMLLIGISYEASFLYAAETSGIENEQWPIICDSCGDGTGVAYGDVNPAWPGHIVTIPVLIKNPADSLVDLQLYGVVSNANFVYSGFDTTNTPWPNATVTPAMLDQDSNSFEIYVHSNGYNLPISSELRRVFDVKLRIEPGESFNVTCYLRFGQRVDVDRYGPGQCQPDTTDGTIVIPDDTTRISLDWTTAYSYQASDDETTKQSFPLKIPVHLYTNYPCSSYCFPFIIPQGTQYVGFDSYEGGSECANLECSGDDVVAVHGRPASEPANNTTFYLGDIKLKIDDFKTQYADTAFTDTLFTKIYTGCDDQTYICYPWGTGSSIAFNDVVKDTAGIVLPKYKVTLKVGRTQANYLDSAIVPITINPTYYTGSYVLFLEYDDTYLTYGGVTPGTGSTMFDVHAHDQDYLESGRHLYKFECDDQFQTGKYAAPNAEQTLFYVRFKVTSAFHCGDSTKVSFTASEDYMPHVWDWFSDDNSSAKIVRNRDSDSSFLTRDGWVIMPHIYVVDGSVTCKKNNVFDAKIDITKLNFTADTKAHVSLSIPVDIDSVTKGDYNWNSATINNTLKLITLTFSATIKGTGTLCHFWFKSNDEGTFIIRNVGRTAIDTITDIYYSVSNEVSAYKSDTVNYHPCHPRLDPNAPLPFVPSLAQNYPNPFNGATNIEFTIAEPGLVTLEIYDIMGRKVKTLANEEMDVGQHAIIWNGIDEGGHEVSGGTYFYTIKTETFRDSKKMIYLK